MAAKSDAATRPRKLIPVSDRMKRALLALVDNERLLGRPKYAEVATRFGFKKSTVEVAFHQYKRGLLKNLGENREFAAGLIDEQQQHRVMLDQIRRVESL
jgi:hypothetical protein